MHSSCLTSRPWSLRCSNAGWVDRSISLLDIFLLAKEIEFFESNATTPLNLLGASAVLRPSSAFDGSYETQFFDAGSWDLPSDKALRGRGLRSWKAPIKRHSGAKLHDTFVETREEFFSGMYACCKITQPVIYPRNNVFFLLANLPNEQTLVSRKMHTLTLGCCMVSWDCGLRMHASACDLCQSDVSLWLSLCHCFNWWHARSNGFPSCNRSAWHIHLVQTQFVLTGISSWSLLGPIKRMNLWSQVKKKSDAVHPCIQTLWTSEVSSCTALKMPLLWNKLSFCWGPWIDRLPSSFAFLKIRIDLGFGKTVIFKALNWFLLDAQLNYSTSMDRSAPSELFAVTNMTSEAGVDRRRFLQHENFLLFGLGQTLRSL